MAIVSGFQSGGGSDTQVTPPTVTIGEYLYNGTSQGPTITGFDSNTMVLSGTTTATNIGSYTFTIALKNPRTMCWSDTGYNAPLVYEWEIILPEVYGAEWDGSSSPIWSRTDLATNLLDPNPYYPGTTYIPFSPFDNISPWKDIKRVTDSDLGELVEIPKYYYKWTIDGTNMKLQISSQYFYGALVSPAHADRGDGEGERDFVYVGRYHCASAYKSTTGVKPVKTTRPTARSAIKNLKSGAYLIDFAMFWTIRMLYLVEFANWDSQATIGYGCGNNSSMGNMGYTDSMPYHTGTTQSLRTTYGLGTQYRYIEGLWDNTYDWCDGIYFAGTNNTDVYIINNPNNFSDSENGTYISTRPTTSNEIKSWTIPNVSGLEWALFPKELTSNSKHDTYVCDTCYCDLYSSANAMIVGGGYTQARNPGLFNMDCRYQGSGVTSGARLMYLPPNS